MNTLAIGTSRISNWSSLSTVFVYEMDLELEFLLVFEFKRATLVPSPLQSTLALRTRASSPPANRIKENKESILLSVANLRISCLRPDFFEVHEATLEALCLLSSNK